MWSLRVTAGRPGTSSPLGRNEAEVCGESRVRALPRPLEANDASLNFAAVSRSRHPSKQQRQRAFGNLFLPSASILTSAFYRYTLGYTMSTDDVQPLPTASGSPNEKNPSRDDDHKRSASPARSPAEEEGAVSDRSEGAVSEDDPPLPDEEAPPLPDEPVPDAADDGWEPRWDNTAQAWYFYNNKTGVSQWENPRVPVATTASYPSYDRFANKCRLICPSPA